MSDIRITRALLSVSNKDGLEDLGRFLAGHGVEILSTGGTAKALRQAGVAVVEVGDHTGFPEIMDGRVKTLHPTLHGGILGDRDNDTHRAQAETHGIAPIDLVVVNLYPFERTVASGADEHSCVENIDIGGPSLIRGAAKNHRHVAVLTDPEDYDSVIAEMTEKDAALGLVTRRRLAALAYRRTALYDMAIADWTAGRFANEGDLHETLLLSATRRLLCRYGENPHQRAAFYVTNSSAPSVATAEQVQGKELSYNNINDTDAALALVAEFEKPAAVIVKHANPCGVAEADTPLAAYERALACDPVSAFGGIIALNRALDRETAEAIADLFVEVVIAPGCDPAAAAVLARKKNLRLLTTKGLPDPGGPGWTVRGVEGGLLVQDRDSGRLAPDALTQVSARAPTPQERADLMFAWRVVKHVKSNAIVFANDGVTLGIGAGQMSRVDSVRIGAWKAEDAARAARRRGLSEGGVAASDAFFPFPDGLIACAEAGATAVIQPGGSVKDDEVIAAANEAGLAMLFTGMRHFRH